MGVKYQKYNVACLINAKFIFHNIESPNSSYLNIKKNYSTMYFLQTFIYTLLCLLSNLRLINDIFGEI